jgi:hypothetical protein
VIELLPATFTFAAAAPPKVTVAPEAKPDPVMVTDVPPPVGPEFGDTPAIVGAGAGPPPERARIVLSFLNAPGEVLR